MALEKGNGSEQHFVAALLPSSLASGDMLLGIGGLEMLLALTCTS